MAESVHAQLEAHLPELEDLHARKLFTREELSMLVKQRAQLERGVRRRAPTKADFLKYIKHEMRVEKLRRMRLQKRTAKQAHRNLASLKSTGVANRSITRRIIFLFQRATRTFKGDLPLWKAYFDFCTATHSHRALSKAVASAIAIHPHQPGIWSFAAWHFFTRKHDAHTARKLMHRGLRINPQSNRLWLSCFLLELEHAHSLYQRRSVLGLPVDEKELLEHKDTVDEHSSGHIVHHADTEDSNTSLIRVIQGAAASSVMHNALDSLGQCDADTVYRFAEIASRYFNAKPVLHEALQLLRQRFVTQSAVPNAHAVALLAYSWLSQMLQPDTPDGCTRLELAAAEFERALAASADEHSSNCNAAVTHLWEAYVHFMEQQSQHSELTDDTARTQLVKHTVSVCERAVKSAAVVEAHVRCLSRIGRFAEAHSAVEDAIAADNCNPTSCLLGTNDCRLKALKLKLYDAQETNPKAIHGYVLQVLQKCAQEHLVANTSCWKDCAELWVTAVELLAAHGCELNYLCEHISCCIARGAGAVVLAAACAVLDAECAQGSLHNVQRAADQLIAQPGVPKQLFWHCIELERSLGATNDRIGKLAELNVMRFGASDEASWLLVLEVELAKGLDGSRTLWRLQKALPDETRQRVARLGRGMISARLQGGT